MIIELLVHTVPDTKYIILILLFYFVHCYYSVFMIHEKYKHSLSMGNGHFSAIHFGLLFHFSDFSLATVFVVLPYCSFDLWAAMYAYILVIFAEWGVMRDPSKWKFNRMNGLDRLVHRKTIFFCVCRLFTIFNSVFIVIAFMK